MTRGRLSALGIAVLILGLAIMRTATASHVTSHKAFSGGSGFKGQVVKTESAEVTVTEVTPSWQTIDSRGFQIPAGESQLVVVRFSGEVVCVDGDFGGAPCLARVLIGRSLGSALELEPGGATIGAGLPFTITPSAGAIRSLCVHNPTSSPLNISVWLQAARGDAGIDSYELDQVVMEITRNAPCSPAVAI